MSVQQPAQKEATPRQMCLIGAGVTAFGLWLVLVGCGVLPIPGGPRNLHGPLWIATAAGLAFLLAGLAVLLQVWGRADASGELPAGAPFWTRVVQYLIGVAIFGCFAVMGSWIAFGPGLRGFSGTFMFFGHSTNEIIGRCMFGLGAVICWLGTLSFAIAGARKLIARRRATRQSIGSPA
jgi:hypothetical protein